MASMIFSTAFPCVVFTAGVTKETYASPLYLVLLLIFLHPNIGFWGRVALFSITCAALISAAPITAFFTLCALSFLTFYQLVKGRGEHNNSGKRDLLLLSIFVAVTLPYYLFYGMNGLNIGFLLTQLLKYDILLPLISLLSVGCVSATLLIRKPWHESRTRTAVAAFAAIISVLTVFLLFTKMPIIPGVPLLPQRCLLYAVPFIILAPLAVIGFNYQKIRSSNAIPLFWLTSVLVITVSFANSDIGLTPRSVDFILPPLSILSAVGLCLMLTLKKPNSKMLAKLFALILLLSIVGLNVYSMYSTVGLQEKYMLYFYVYKPQEYSAAEWFTTLSNKQGIAGDVKVSYLLEGYFGVNVNVYQGLDYLTGKGSKPSQLFVYDQMLKNGYVLGSGLSADLPDNWTGRLSKLNLIYTNRLATLYSS